jgi:hypothetical protein
MNYGRAGTYGEHSGLEQVGEIHCGKRVACSQAAGAVVSGMALQGR